MRPTLTRRRVVAAVVVAVLALPALLVAEALWALCGSGVGFAPPSPAAQRFGLDRGAATTFVVIGDSTGAGQGAPYADGIAVGAAEHLAEDGPVPSSASMRCGACTVSSTRRCRSAAASGSFDLTA